MIGTSEWRMNMKKMKTILGFIIFTIIFCFGLGKFVETGGNSGSSSSANSQRSVKILTYANWNPFEYVKNGKVVGFDVDLIKYLSKEAGYTYTIKNSSWDSMFTQLQNKQADIGISGITITKDRKKTFEFSNPYFVSRQSIVAKQNSEVKSATDLDGQKVVVQTGSTGQEAAQKIFGKNSANILKSSSGVTYQMVIHGQAMASIGDDTSNKKFVAANQQDGLKVIEDNSSFEPEYFGIMFPKGSKYKNAYDKALTKAIKNGTYSKIYKKWFDVKPDTTELLKNNESE
jgi:polar amino acid transport system substrate-binding protein